MYRDLLKKYMHWIGHDESGQHLNLVPKEAFTEAEWKALSDIDLELQKEHPWIGA